MIFHSETREAVIRVLAAITVGGNLVGPIGMLLGVPAASAAYALLKEATDKREARNEELHSRHQCREI